MTLTDDLKHCMQCIESACNAPSAWSVEASVGNQTIDRVRVWFRVDIIVTDDDRCTTDCLLSDTSSYGVP